MSHVLGLAQEMLSDRVILPLFLAIALGYAAGKFRSVRSRLGRLSGTLLSAIVIGVIGVEFDDNIEQIAFA